jgi:eukaryotic-like serine/threonine-protein kinase
VEAAAARAQIARSEGDRDQAIALLSAALPPAELAYADKPRDLLTIYNNLLVNLAEANRIDEMAPVFARAEAVLKRTQQERSVQALAIMQLQGVSQFKAGNPALAEASFARVVALRRAMFAPSAGLAVDLLQLARVKLALGKPAEALPLLAEARTLALANLGEGALPTVAIGIGLAEAQAETGSIAEAETLLAALKPRIKGLPPLVDGMWLRAQAILLLRKGDAAAAGKALDAAEAIYRAAGPPGESYLKALPKLRARIAAVQATAISR